MPVWSRFVPHIVLRLGWPYLPVMPLGPAAAALPLISNPTQHPADRASAYTARGHGGGIMTMVL